MEWNLVLHQLRCNGVLEGKIYLYNIYIDIILNYRSPFLYFNIKECNIGRFLEYKIGYQSNRHNSLIAKPIARPIGNVPPNNSGNRYFVTLRLPFWVMNKFVSESLENRLKWQFFIVFIFFRTPKAFVTLETSMNRYSRARRLILFN